MITTGKMQSSHHYTAVCVNHPLTVEAADKLMSHPRRLTVCGHWFILMIPLESLAEHVHCQPLCL